MQFNVQIGWTNEVIWHHKFAFIIINDLHFISYTYSRWSICISLLQILARTGKNYRLFYYTKKWDISHKYSHVQQTYQYVNNYETTLIIPACKLQTSRIYVTFLLSLKFARTRCMLEYQINFLSFFSSLPP